MIWVLACGHAVERRVTNDGLYRLRSTTTNDSEVSCAVVGSAREIDQEDVVSESCLSLCRVDYLLSIRKHFGWLVGVRSCVVQLY